MYAVDTTSGEEVWQFDEPSGRIISSPSVVDDTVFFGTTDNDDTLYAVDADTGTQTWEFSSPEGSVDSSPTVIDGIVYVGAMDNNLYAVDATTGEQQWEFEAPSTIRSSPTVVDKNIYVSTGATLEAVDSDTGQQEWSYRTNSDRDIVGGSSPTVADGIVCFGSSDALYAVDAASGEEEWVYEQPTGQVFSSPTIVNETVFVGSYAGGLYAVDLSTGEEEWSFTDAVEGTMSSPTVVDGIIFVGSRSGTLYALDAGIDGSSEGSRVELETLGYHDGPEQSIDIKTSSSGNSLTTVFRQAENQSDNPLFLGALGAGVLGIGYSAYRRFQSDPEPTRATVTSGDDSASDAEEVVSDDSMPVIDTYSEITLGEVVDTTDRVQIQSGVVDQQTVWVITPRETSDETIDTEQISALSDQLEPWAKMDSAPNLVSVYEVGRSPLPWAVVEQVNYPALVDNVHQFDSEELRESLQQICEAVHHVHRYGTAYRNLTTESVLQTEEGSIKLRGVLDQFDEPDPWYNTPEEFDGESTERSTVYRIGLIAYELFTGTLPYSEYPDGIAKESILSDKRASMSDQINHIPKGIESIIIRALETSPEDRHETVLHLRDDISQVDI